MNKIFLSIIVPVYNGENTIELLFKKIHETCKKRNYSFEVVFVWDCGFDNSWEKILILKKQYPKLVKAIRLTRNFGQHNALICGFQFAEGKFLVTIDEDLQQDPSDIFLLIEKQKNTNADVVYGKPDISKHTIFRSFTSEILRLIIDKGISGIHKDYSPFRLIKSDIAKQVIGMQNSYTFLDGYLTWVTGNFTSVKVTHHKRFSGRSSYSLIKLIKHSMNIFFTFSDIPVKILNVLSLLIIISSTIYTFYLFFRKIFFNDLIPGYTSLSISIGFSTGVLMIGISAIAQYLYRINEKTTKKPNYIIREQL